MPPQTPMPQPASRSIVLPVLGALVAGLVLGGGAVWAYGSLSSTNAPAPVVDNDRLSVTPGFKTYENKEIGIVFEYPEAWGEIRVEKEVGCFEAKEKQEMAATGDPCEQVRLSFADVSVGVFFAVQTPLHWKYPIGRGAFFGDVYVDGSESYLAQYCDSRAGGKPCAVATNSNGVFFVKSYEVLGMDDETGWKYLLRSPHRYYSSVVLSSSRLGPAWQADFDKLVGSLRFLQ